MQATPTFSVIVCDVIPIVHKFCNVVVNVPTPLVLVCVTAAVLVSVIPVNVPNVTVQVLYPACVTDTEDPAVIEAVFKIQNSERIEQM